LTLSRVLSSVDAKAEKDFGSKSSKAKAVKSEEGHSDNDEVSGKSAKAAPGHGEDMLVKGTDASAHSESADGESKGKPTRSRAFFSMYFHYRTIILSVADPYVTFHYSAGKLFKSKSTKSKSEKSGKTTEPDPIDGTVVSSGTGETAESTHSATAKSHKGEYDHSMGSE
jgi:hypothetical protein